jgi:AcrR family transcriptional regulator
VLNNIAAGRRESVKAEKRRRIIATARRVFKTQGFERATTQGIARLARIATGTLFLYARDKRELLLMVFNDELATITETSIAAVDAGAPLLEQLLNFYRPRFAFWASDVALARIVTAEVYASRAPAEVGAELARVNERQKRMVATLAECVAAYARTHGLTLRERPEAIANMVHYLYIGELRVWLSSAEPRVADAMAHLERYYALLLSGIFGPAGGRRRPV